MIGMALSYVGIGRLLVAVLVALGIYVGVMQPAWAIDPLRDASERVLQWLGAAVLPLGAWAIAIVVLLRRRPLYLIRKWRYALGSAFVVTGVFAALAQMEAALPLIGTASLGGSVGRDAFGESRVIGWATGVVMALVGLSLMAPGITRRIAGSSATGAAAGAAVGTSRGAQASAAAGRAAGRGVRRAGRFAVAAKKGVEAARGPRKEDSALAEEFGEFLNAGQDTEALRAVQDTPSLQSAAPALPEPVEPLEAEEAPVPEPQRRSAPTPKPRSRPARAVGGWELPPASLLAPAPAATAVNDQHQATARLIEETLLQHRVEVQVAEIRPGPTVTMFGLVPGWNRQQRKGAQAGGDAAADDRGDPQHRVRVDAILAREKDLALALAAPSLRIEAPVPGESVVGIEVPNRSLEGVAIRAVVESAAFKAIADAGGLPVALGQATAGEPVALDLLAMPHLLIAGATGSGKSVCINSVLSSLILSQQPDDVRLMLVDPKRVELTPYNGIPHLITPVVVEPDRVVRLLRGAIAEMLRRYQLLEEAGVRNIQSYNRSAKATEHLPYIVICIDELADLMMTSAFDVEQGICRLAQLGRATGIHMIVATQRPSVDVVTGLIKANFPSRIAFAVASQVDSRTILDGVGAERLLGRGDMLFLSPDAAKPKRVQGAYVSEADTEALAGHWRDQQGPAVPEVDLEELARAAEREGATLTAAPPGANGAGEDASLYEQALDLASRERQLSTSLLQRRLRIGYPRAARLMDQMEDEGIVGPNSEPGKPRPVLYTPDDA